MRFHVLGLGSIGSLLSHHLRRTIPPTNSITLIHRTQSQARDALSNGGSIRVEYNGLVTTANGFYSEGFEVPKSSRHISRQAKPREKNKEYESDISEPIESLFVTTKAHQTVPAIRRLLPRLSNQTTIVLMQNGMGVYEELVHNIFRNPQNRPHFILASNTHGAFRKGTYDIVHAGLGSIEFGIVPDPAERDFEAGFVDETVPKLERTPRIVDIASSTDDPSFEKYRSLRSTIAALLLLEPLNASWKPIAEIQTILRRKLVVNAIINPLTALMGCRNGDILNTAASHRLMQRICQEASDVYAAQVKAGSQTWLDSLTSQGMSTENVAIGRLPRALTRPMLEEEVLRVAKATKGNISSMLADIQHGRTTEIDFINGYLLKLGSTYHIEMPATATLLNLVKMRGAIPLDQML
ncbi:ketopantoate reductase PanE/ApbA C terminal-domain-containing protein [Collybia nuda]|uniref:2-dehydropantoate 2-reductase n=1 Tax=Collybia nuda TaxID=64659 RepID=A0A9P5YJG2_9AGAR|nr:ketopantoate reductase PanE/ApbA C terminal-domain-containing protein [Collybia nuda]